jgi:hypothetical protein
MTLSGFRACAHSLERDAVRARLCNAFRVRTGLRAGPILRALQRATSSLAAQRLYEYAGDPSVLCYARPGLNLPADLASLLEWRLHAILLRTPAQKLGDEQPSKLAAQLLEHHGTDLDTCLGRLFGDFELYLRNWLL